MANRMEALAKKLLGLGDSACKLKPIGLRTQIAVKVFQEGCAIQLCCGIFAKTVFP
jgi:hypothetical protein